MQNALDFIFRLVVYSGLPDFPCAVGPVYAQRSRSAGASPKRSGGDAVGCSVLLGTSGRIRDAAQSMLLDDFEDDCRFVKAGHSTVSERACLDVK